MVPPNLPGVWLPDDGVAVDAAPVLIAATRLAGEGRRRRDPVALRGRRGHDSVLFESPGKHRLKKRVRGIEVAPASLPIWSVSQSVALKKLKGQISRALGDRIALPAPSLFLPYGKRRRGASEASFGAVTKRRKQVRSSGAGPSSVKAKLDEATLAISTPSKTDKMTSSFSLLFPFEENSSLTKM